MFSKLLTLSFWVSTDPLLKTTVVVLFLIFGIFFAFGLILRGMAKKQKGDPMNSVYKKASTASFTMSVLGLIVLWLSWERVVYLGMRLNYVIWFVGVIVWGVFLYKRYKAVPPMMRDKEQKEAFEKYLPKKK